MNNSERRSCVERLVNEALIEAIARKEHLLDLAKKTDEPATTTTDLEKWLDETTLNNSGGG